MTGFRGISSISREGTTFLMRYALGITIEIAVALWLLSVAKGDFAWAVWLAYLILASAALATFIGLSWCWLWLIGSGLGWFVTAVLFVGAAWLLTSGTRLSLDILPGLGR